MKNKAMKLTSIVLAIVFALSLASYAEDGDAITMAAGSVSVEKGEGKTILDVPIKLEGSACLTSLQVNIKFSDEIKCVEFIDGGSLKGIVEPALNRNSITIPFAEAVGVEATEGLFATLKMEVPCDKDAKYLIDVTVVEAYDSKYEEMTNFKGMDGCITVGSPEGDYITADYSDTYSEYNSSDRKSDAIFMCVDSNTAFVNGTKIFIDPDNKKVVPYIKNSRTLVPLRFVSESVGAEVLWEKGWDGCIIKKDDKEIKITFGSAEFTVNGEKLTYDAPIEVVMGRTMVPVRFVTEQLGYNVYWDATNYAVVITPKGNPWIAGRDAEKIALGEVLVTIKGILP